MSEFEPTAQESMIWSGIAVGDAIVEVVDHQFGMYLLLMASLTRFRRFSVLDTNHSSYSGHLATTNPAGTTLRMASGAARVWAHFYFNDANIDFDCSASGYYRLVLRLTQPLQDVTGQTVRATLKGPLTAGYPGLTEDQASIFEVSIAKVYSNGSTLTITDDRKFLRNVSLPFRQGGDSVKWSTAGTNKYATIGVNIQCGAVAGTGFDKDSAYYMVWPSQNGDQVVPAYDYTGLCFIQAKSDGTVPAATELTLSAEWDSYGIFNAPSSQTNLESVMFMVVGNRYG